MRIIMLIVSQLFNPGQYLIAHAIPSQYSQFDGPLTTIFHGNTIQNGSASRRAKGHTKRSPLTEDMCDEFDLTIVDPETRAEIMVLDYLWVGAYCRDPHTIYSVCELDLFRAGDDQVGDLIVTRDYACLADEICMEFFDEASGLPDAECMDIAELITWFTNELERRQRTLACSINLADQLKGRKPHFAPAASEEVHFAIKAFSPQTKNPVRVSQLYFSIEEPGKRPRIAGVSHGQSTSNLAFHYSSRNVVIKACALLTANSHGIIPHLGFFAAVHIGKFLPHKRHHGRSPQVSITDQKEVKPENPVVQDIDTP